MMHNKIFPINTIKYSGTIEDLPSDLPKYSLPFALSVSICQIFPLQNIPMFSTLDLYSCTNKKCYEVQYALLNSGATYVVWVQLLLEVITA